MIIAGLSSVPSRAVTHHAVLCKSPENGMRRLGFGRVSVRTTHSNRFYPRREAIEDFFKTGKAPYPVEF